MSVNITVNGKFSKQSQLRDPEGYKKQLEDERRKLRLQQVRAQSKELARKIRTDVSQEKERQLRNLEAVKAQELNLWRKTVVAQKSFDFRTALNQVGSAHLAAKRERRIEQERAVAREQELLREKERGRIAITKELQSPRQCKPLPRKETERPKKATERPKKQTEKTRKETESPRREKSKEKQRPERVTCEVEQPKETVASTSGNRRDKMYVCFDEKFDVKSCSCSIDTDSDDQWSTDEVIETCELLDSSSSSVSDIDTSSRKDTKSTQTEASKEASLKRAPPVLLDVDVDPIKSAIIVAPDHVVDKHIETNRQFDIVISMDPKKETAATQTDDLISKDVQVSTLSLENESAPRYTQISDLIAKQKNSELSATEKRTGIMNSEQMSTEKISSVSTSASFIVNKTAPTSTVTSIPSKSTAAAFVASVTTEQPRLATTAAPLAATKMPASQTVPPLVTYEDSMPKASRSLPTTRLATVQRKSVPPYPSRQSRVSRLSTLSGGTTSSSKETGDRSEGAGSFVQFYDYNNKYAKEYNQPIDAVAVPQNKKAEPNAMQQAALENRRLNSREKNIEKLRQKSEERGKAALEREKVRRDCVDLTEKLDALAQKGQAALPTDANLHGNAYFAEKVARKEAKVNNAIEELLSRPAIITCADRRNDMPTTSRKSSKLLTASVLNLGSRLFSGESDNAASISTDTEESGSILLGYIDDQRDQIRNELTQCDGAPAKNLEKKEKLKQLLGRIEALRASLLKELNNPDKETVPIGDAQISKEQAKPYEGSTIKLKRQNQKDCQELEERERLLKEREMTLQKELAEVIQTQKNLKNGQAGSSAAPYTAVKITAGKEQIVERTTGDKPLEIVIKVKGDKKSSKRKSKSTQNKDNVPKEQPVTHTVPPIKSNEAATGNRRGSYDSNSTAYQSIPPTLPVATEQFVERIQQLESNKKQQNSSTDTTGSSSSATVEQRRVPSRKHPKGFLNPLIAQYVQRLLGMSRESVMALEASSSDIDTPSSSVINITTNLADSKSPSSMISEDHLQRVERFVNENRSFINELEESIRSHSNVPLETSLHRFEQIWKQKLKREQTKETSKQVDAKLKTPKVQTVKEKPKKVEQQTTTKAAQPTQKAEKIPQKKIQVKEVKVTKTSARVVAKNAGTEEEQFYATETQLKNYAELTKNCSNRIAELTELITKVRQEKQRILEVTLTSVSDNGRNSTEYADLPAAQKSGELKSESSSSEYTQKKIPELPSSALNTERKKAQEDDITPLEKHKQTGRSRDSGISMPSRPVTALGLDTEAEPPSFASSTATITHTNTQSSSTQRKSRPPPPTLNRYSPQLPEDDVVHELSTIVEVDTPATSRINTSIQQVPSETQQPTSSHGGPRHKAFPTFDEYLKELHLDLTILDPEQSLRMEHEYNDLIEALKEGKGEKAYSYEEFPTLITYLKDLTGNDQICQSPETMENLFGCLRLAPLIAKPFPSHREYIERMHNNSPNNLIDSESLENLTELQSLRSETESETLNIEAELKRRNILKQSFRSSSTRYDVFSTSTGGKQQERPKQPPSQSTFETGIEKLTSSTTTDSASEKFQRELMALGLKWHKSMRSKEKEAAALSSSTSDSLRSNTMHEKSKVPTKHDEKKNETTADCLSDSESSDKPLNLRDFLTRQLMKHVAATSSCESSLSGESLRSQFFMAVLDSMTPSGSPRTNTATQSFGQRQKTSTPVQTSNTQPYLINEHSKSNEASQSQLFSGESNLSFVQVPAQNKKKSTNDKTRKRQEREGGAQ